MITTTTLFYTTLITLHCAALIALHYTTYTRYTTLTTTTATTTLVYTTLDYTLHYATAHNTIAYYTIHITLRSLHDATTATALHWLHCIQLQLHTLQVQLHYTTLHPAIVVTTIATTSKNVTPTDSNHLSVHQWIRSAIRDSQQPTSPICFLFLKLPPPPCAVLPCAHSSKRIKGY